MIPLSNLLARFSGLRNTEKDIKNTIIALFQEEQIPLTLKQITLTKTSVRFSVPPIIKTEILLKKDVYIKKLQAIPGLSGITSIE